MKKITASNLAVLVFFLALLGLGLAIYSSYGMSWDEPTQLDLGIRNYRYIFKDDPALLKMRDRWYGPAFEIFLVVFQSRANDAQIYLSRHLINFLTYFAGCIAFYFLGKRFTRSNWLALAGTICLVVSPQIFSNAFYNSKDIPFMVLYTFSLISMLWYLDRPTPFRAVVHALVTAVLVAVRLPGMMIPALTLMGLGVEVVCKRVKWRVAGASSVVYLLSALGGCVLAWPVLWLDPLNGIVTAFQFMSHFPHATNMLYMGQTISSLNLPWHYVPVWMAVTTPLLYLVGFVLGAVLVVWRLGHALTGNFLRERRDEMLVMGALVGPILTVIVLNTVLYDGWRQMYFVYPAFILVAVKGMQAFWQWLDRNLPRLGRSLPKWTSTALVVAILAVGILPVAGWMVQNHPYENVFFNPLAGNDMKTVQQRFMLDYWGLAYRSGIEAMLQQDPAPTINVFMETEPGQRTLAMLPASDAKRVHVVSALKDADYFIGNYYMTAGDYPFKHEIYAVHVGNAKILSVFRLDDSEKS